MLAKLPMDDPRLTKAVRDRQILRMGLIAELDAIDLYEQLAAASSDKEVKDMLLDIAREEKTHVGEFLTLLLERDKEQVSEIEAAKKELRERSS